MLGLIVAAVIVLATVANVARPSKHFNIDHALPPLPDNVAANEPIPHRLAYKFSAGSE